MRSRENSIRRMIAYSRSHRSIHLYGFGLGTELALASVFHIICHAATKALLFLSASSLTEVSGDSTNFFDLTEPDTGIRWRVAFTAGSLSMVGFPMLGGFISKILFAQAAVGHAYKMLPTLIALAISTILNTVYFLKTVIRIYTPMRPEEKKERGCKMAAMKEQPVKAAALICFVALNLVLGLFSQPILMLLERGLSMFA